MPDYRGYFLAPLWLCLAGVAGLAQVAARHARYQRYAPLAAALPLLALAVSPTHLLERRDDPSLADVMAHGALEEAPPDAILVVSADHWVAPLLFAQEVEGVRPDVVIVATGLGSSRWYWEHLFARHPGLTPMTLVGPGGRAGRLRRLVQANPERPVLLESIALGEPLGLLPCGVGWMVWTEGACEAGGPEAHVASAAIERTAPLSGEALEVAARVNERRGEALWRFGRARAAARAMMAALPPSGLGRPLPGDLPDRGPPLTGPLPDWSREAALHDRSAAPGRPCSWSTRPPRSGSRAPATPGNRSPRLLDPGPRARLARGAWSGEATATVGSPGRRSPPAATAASSRRACSSSTPRTCTSAAASPSATRPCSRATTRG